MTRRPWTSAEIEDVGFGWERFHALHPERSYDAWEVKRRRLAGGSAGTDRRHVVARALRLRRAITALKALTTFVEDVARG